ncbi:MAG: T9SS type A sorting domain-containing protein [Balneolaceae bacterium]|nr:T9SS type A sorting domain-containing protein [Balneolaceae bacterium]
MSLKKTFSLIIVFSLHLFVSNAFSQTQDSKELPKGQLIEVPVLEQNRTNQFKGKATTTATVVFENSFESGLENWNVTGSWAVGEPTSGPNSGFNSLNTAGTNLTGDYSDNADDSLTTPSITLPSISDSQSLTLQFMEWFELESGFDYGYIEISTDNGETWTTLSSRDGDSEWRETEVNLTPYAGEDIILLFRFTSDDENNFAGWFVDNVRITDSTPEPLAAEITSLNSQNFPNIYANVKVYTNGTSFPGLSQENFTVFENGTQQTDLFNVTPPEEGGGVRRADVIFLMDNSGSMGPSQDEVQENVFSFVDDLAASDVDYALGLARYGSFENSGNPIIEDNGSLTSDVEYFKNDMWMRNRSSGNDEPGYYSITEAANSVSFRPGAQRIFIIITDEPPDQGGASQSDALTVLQESDITLFALTESSLFSYFEPLTEPTGGQFFDIYSPFDDILDFIAAQVADTYVVSYQSSNPSFDGTTRNVRVEATYEGNTASDEASYVPGAAPTIQRTQQTISLSDDGQPENRALTIEATVTDDIAPGIQQATLFYKPTPDPASSYQSVVMTSTSGNIFQAEIPGNTVATPGIDYYITATDGNTTSSSPSTNPGASPFNIAILPNEPPVIEHTPITEATAEQPIDIAFNATDNTRELERVKLYYRRTGQLNYEVEVFDDFVNLSDFQLTIPAEFVTTDGVEYYIEAEDDWGVASTLPKEDAVDEPYSTEVSSTFPLKIVDVNGDPIANKEFTIYNVTEHNFSENGPPDSPVGIRTTDDQGRIELNSSSFSENDQIKIEREVYSESANGNSAYKKLDNERYKILLDNAQFNSVGKISYPTVTSSLYDIKEISLDHTMIVQNLAVSVEWDASDDYLNDILEGMKKTSNYMYDVTDGQFYIGEVAVFENKKYWKKADIRRHADNQFRPIAYSDIIFERWNQNGVRMPRIWKLTYDLTRNHFYTKGDLSFPYDFKTVGHELGHYLFYFKDEYKNDSEVKVWEEKTGSEDPWNFGFMDSPQNKFQDFQLGGEYSSEMSSEARYPSDGYKVTSQWQKHQKPCWDTFEELFEGVYDDIYCPIKKPSERSTGDKDYLLGPNNDLNDLTIDVGSSINDSPDPQYQNVGAFNKHLNITGALSDITPDILFVPSVTLIKSSRVIKQGKTNDEGWILVLGAENGDVVRYFNYDHTQIYSGIIPISDGSNAPKVNVIASTNQDSLIVEVEPVDGNFKTTATASFSEKNRINFTTTFKESLPTVPDFEMYNNMGSPKNPSVSVSQESQYSVSITEPLGETGFFSFIAEDNSSDRFFVDHDYILYDSLSVNNRLELSGPSGSGELLLDSLNTSIENVLMLTSSFPPILNGLPESAELAGDVQSIASYPFDQQFSGANALTIRYADSDINEGRESSITIFKWISENSVWKKMDGMVDTVRNAVVSQIPFSGTYAAFTTEFETQSDGGEGQQGLMLDQNYPNPFSRLTTIIYTIPKEQHVTLTVYNILGRKVATLVDKKQEAAKHYVSFNAEKLGLASGMYIYRLVTEGQKETEKMMFIR